MDEANSAQNVSSGRRGLASFRLFRGNLSVATLPVLVLLCWLAWEIVSNTAADNNAVAQPEAALAWVPSHPTALARLSEQQLILETAKTDTAAITAMAQQALRGDPLKQQAFRVLAFAAEANGDRERAEVLMALAGSRSLRDLRVQAWLFNRRLLAGDVGGALAHVDAVLRVWPNTFDVFLATLVGLAGDDDRRDALVARLKMAPPWRDRFLAQLPGESADPKQLYGLYSALRAEEASLTVQEFRPYLQRLAALGEYELAYAMQVEFLPPERLAMLGHLNNGGFDHPISGLPFDWTVAYVRGARTSIVVDAESNRKLRVEFHNTRVPYRHVSQLLILQPGTYQLTGIVTSLGLANDRGMQWVISCVGGAGQQLGATDRVSGTNPWRDFILPFEVPNSDDCRVQEIRLMLAARIAAEQQVAGEITYDSLHIERRGTQNR